MNDFEKLFRHFVLQSGGELIPESIADGEERADYLFRAYRVVAELKTLDKNAREDHDRKIQELLWKWIRDKRILAYGRVNLEFQKLPPDLQREWMSILVRPVETIIRKAQRQIRSTNQVLEIEGNKGLLIIANDRNLLYTKAADYMAVVARVLNKRTNGLPRFSAIQAVLYISKGEWCFRTFGETRDPELDRLQQALLDSWGRFLLSHTRPFQA